MDEQTKQTTDLVSRYRRSFREFGTRALWNKRFIESPLPEDALVIGNWPS